jgi:hypothetical protein
MLSRAFLIEHPIRFIISARALTPSVFFLYFFDCFFSRFSLTHLEFYEASQRSFGVYEFLGKFLYKLTKFWFNVLFLRFFFLVSVCAGLFGEGFKKRVRYLVTHIAHTMDLAEKGISVCTKLLQTWESFCCCHLQRPIGHRIGDSSPHPC